MNRQFGALSGLAIVLIVINHSIYFGTYYPEGWGYPSVLGWGRTLLSLLQSLGWFAVPTFLFISGSFVSYVAQGDPSRLSRKFMFATLRHIIVPYVIWSIVFYGLVYVIDHETYNLFGYVKNLLVGYPYHFVPLLIVFYLLSPLMARIGRSFGLEMIALIALYQLVLMNILNPEMLGFSFPTWFHYLAPPVIRVTLSKWGIFFPLGLVYGLHAKRVVQWSKLYFWWFAGITLILFVLGNLDSMGVIRFPIAFYLAPVPFMLLLPAIKRETIPFVHLLERIGKRSYGVYLMSLIVVNLVLIGFNLLIPAIFNLFILFFPILFIMTLMIPLLFMEASAKGPIKPVYRYIFG